MAVRLTTRPKTERHAQMETSRLKITDIIADEKFNARKVYNQEVIDTLVKDIDKNGQYNPLLVAVHPTKPGKFTLISGFTRLKALVQIEKDREAKAKENKTEALPVTAFVQITDKTEKLDQYYLNLGENIQREGLTFYDIGRRIADISQEFDLTAAQIGAKIGLGAKHVANYIRIMTKVNPEILEHFKVGHSKATTMNLAKLAAMTSDEQSAAWDELCGVVRAEEGEGEGDDTGGTTPTATPAATSEKAKRASEAMLASALVAVTQADLTAEVKKAYLVALRFALGTVKTIPGVYNPAKPPAKASKGNGTAEATR